MSSKSALGSATRAITHRVLRCAGGLFAPKAIFNLGQAHQMALRPPLTPLNDTGVPPNDPCARLRGPGFAELNRYQSP
jgi:hypothetical protein